MFESCHQSHPHRQYSRVVPWQFPPTPMNSNVCEVQWTPLLTSSSPITYQELLHGFAVWDHASPSGHICDHLFIQCPQRYIQCPWSSRDLHGWVFSFQLRVSSRVSLQVWDRHFPSRASQNLLPFGGVTGIIFTVSNSITLVFETSSALWAPVKHRVSRIYVVAYSHLC